MRDIALAGVILILIPFILRQPWIGILVGAWISLMSPHRYTFGFAYDFPFAFIVARRDRRGRGLRQAKVEFPRHTLVYMMLVLMVWFTVTTLFAIEPEAAMAQWEKVMKVFVLILLAGVLIRTREQINALLWVLVLSVGMFGVKGGVFTILTGGVHKVYGPPVAASSRTTTPLPSRW